MYQQRLNQIKTFSLDSPAYAMYCITVSKTTVLVSIVITLTCVLFIVQNCYENTFIIQPAKSHNTTISRAGPRMMTRLQKVRQLMVNRSDKNVKRRLLEKPDDEFILHKLRILNGKVKPEDLMTSGPFDFLPDYRNPCWRVESQKFPPIKCLPYFYLVGAPKSGTTDLYYRLIRHPSISDLAMKEPHWLTRSHYYAKSLSGIIPTLDGYIDIFRSAIKDVYRIKEENGWHPKAFGDGSASTLWDNDYWRLLPEFENLSEPLYTNADYIHHLNPKTKIIAILRNPVDRLYSDYLFFRSKKSPKGFHNSAVDAMNYINTCLTNNTLRYCVYHSPPESQNYVRIRIGIYFIHLKEYFRVFPRRQIHVIKLEEYSKDIKSSLKDVFGFLEVGPVAFSELDKISTQKNKNTRRLKDKTMGEMLPKTRKLLQEFYHPYNEELEKLLGEKFNYNRIESDLELVKLKGGKKDNGTIRIENDGKVAKPLTKILNSYRINKGRKRKNIRRVP